MSRQEGFQGIGAQEFRAPEEAVELVAGFQAVLQLAAAFHHEEPLLAAGGCLLLQQQQVPDFRILRRCDLLRPHFTKFIAPKTPSEAASIMIPASITPSITKRTLFLKSMFRKLAARVPVHAPVPGRGMPTNSSRAT